MASELYMTLIIVLCFLVASHEHVLKLNQFSNTKKRSNFTWITSKNGYQSEEHNIITDDGYILKTFRIPRGKNCFGKIRKPPVILMHGILMSSDSWLDVESEANLVYLIADACFDLWVGNARGNYYARSHVYLNPDEDPEFWSFTIDQMGYYDLPATVDYVLEETGSEKLNFVGFSQGAGTFFVMCSERPEYCDKIGLLIAISPASRQTNTRSVPITTLLKTFADSEKYLENIGVYEVFATGGPTQVFLEKFCSVNSFTAQACLALIAFVDSEHLYSITKRTVVETLRHFPAGTSVRNMARYGQSIRHSEFLKYDFGSEKNVQVYGCDTPPAFNLMAVTVPVVVIYGANDNLVSAKDVKWLVKRLPNVIESLMVEDPKWNHFDVPYSQFTGKQIFSKVSQYLHRYSHL